MSDIFEKASRQALRFASTVGELTTEQLWHLPLTSKNKACLDGIARNIYSELKGLEEVSFVESKPDPRKSTLSLQLDIVKHIIAVRLEEN